MDYLFSANHFHDFDEYADFIRQGDLNHELIKSGHLDAEVTQYLDHRIIFAFYQSNLKMIQTGIGKSNYIHFLLVQNEHPGVYWRSHNLRYGCIGILRPGRLHYSVLPDNFKGHSVAINVEYLRQNFPEFHAFLVIQKVELIHSSKQDMIDLTNLLEEKLSQFKTGREDKNVDGDFILNLISGLEKLMMNGRSVPERNSVSLRALNYIFSRLSETPGIKDICADLEISDRSLRDSFQKEVGISPKQYLKGLYLNKVRKDLKYGFYDRVSDVVNKWGFWHMGQFAKDYKDIFGELPSETASQDQVLIAGSQVPDF